MRTLAQHANRLCLLVARGPSRARAAEHLGYGQVATINHACLDVPGPIDWAFFCDWECLVAARPAFERIAHFVLPERLHELQGALTHPWDSFPGLPLDRCVIYPHVVLPVTREALAAAVAADQVALCYTVTAAAHVLSLLGFREVLLLGNEDLDGVCRDPLYTHVVDVLRITCELVTARNHTRYDWWRPA